MSDIDDLLSRLPYDTLAQQLGVDEDSARAAAGQAIPALLAGLQAQTANEASAQKLVGAHRLRPSIRAWSRNCSRSSPRSC